MLKGVDLISDKFLTCGLKEGSKADGFLKVRLHGSSMVKRYEY